MDEAGRGPLAGPVVAAAVVLPRGFDCGGLGDSKQLSARARECEEARIRAQALYCIAQAAVQEIDTLNILHASMLAMQRAIEGLAEAFESIWIDGNRSPRPFEQPVHCVVKGDGKIAAIAAASILAKTCRDRLMVEAGECYPGYGFESHFGYPTPEHLRTLESLGPCPLHRRSFEPVRRLCFPDIQLCLPLDA